MQYNFEWNPIKAKENIRKHGVSFDRAAGIFLDPFAMRKATKTESKQYLR